LNRQKRRRGQSRCFYYSNFSPSRVDCGNGKTDFVVWSLVRYTLVSRAVVKIFRILSLIVSSLQSFKTEKHQKNAQQNVFSIFLKLCSELIIKNKVLKIFTAFLLATLNLTRPQTTKSAPRFWRSITLNKN